MNLNFRKDDPGAVQFGNFINYYDFNSAEERIKLFPTHIWNELTTEFKDPLLVLDVGCNAGNLTQLFYKFFVEQTKRNVIVLGIDIDQSLIDRASDTNLYKDNVNYSSVDIMSFEGKQKLKTFLQGFNKERFDIVCCMSITMWIHLNNGDDGLKRFLNEVSDFSHILAIEPQPWKCYLTAVRRMKRADDSFPKFNELQMRNNVEGEIEKYLEMICNQKKVFETIPTKWNRKLCFYWEKT